MCLAHRLWARRNAGPDRGVEIGADGLDGDIAAEEVSPDEFGEGGRCFVITVRIAHIPANER